MPRHDWVVGTVELAVDDVKVGATDPAAVRRDDDAIRRRGGIV
jgi:hypothetical protein